MAIEWLCTDLIVLLHHWLWLLVLVNVMTVMKLILHCGSVLVLA